MMGARWWYTRDLKVRSQVTIHNWGDFFPLYFIGLAYQGMDIVFRFIIEYSSLGDFGPLGNK